MGGGLTLKTGSLTDGLRRLAAARRLNLLAVAPALALIVVAFAIPIVSLLWRSVSEPEFGIANYVAVLTDPTSMRILGRTFKVAAIVTIVAALFAYPYAYAMTQATPTWRKIMMAIVLVPFWTSLMARSFAWIIIFQDSGLINTALRGIGLSPVPLLGTETAVIIGTAQVLLPFAVLPLFATMATIDGRLMTAAQGLGAPRRTAFLLVYFPLSVPGLLAAALLVFVLSLGFYITPDLLGSPQNMMLSQLIGTQASQLLDFPGAGALATILLIATLAILGISAKFFGGLASITGERTD